MIRRLALPGLQPGRRSIAVFKIIFTAVALATFVNPAFAQIDTGNAFLQGTYAEVGVSPNGSFGSTVDAPAGYHPRPGNGTSQLGFVVDRHRDGWAAGSPVFDGDFFVPGTPFEAFFLTFSGTTYRNSRTTDDDINGALSNYSSTAGVVSVEWNGDVNGVDVDKQISLQTDGTELRISVTLTNNSGGDLTNVYYARIFDPDNNQPVNGSFTTTNTIESQPPDSPVALVSSTQPDGSYIALMATDVRARAGRSCQSNKSAEELWNGTASLLSGSDTSDSRTCLAFKFPSIPDGESVSFSYSYTLATPTYDFGDAPSPYPTLQADAGARHLLTESTLFLGVVVDEEDDGQPSATVDGDDLAGDIPDDEDGVLLPASIEPGAPVSVTVVSSGIGKLNAWIDFNRDGDWGDPGEQIFTDEPVTGGTNALGFTAPAFSAVGTTAARFRLDSTGGLAPTGTAGDGEVEDYAVSVLAASITGLVFNDDNANGEQNGTELGAGGVTIALYRDDGDSLYEPDAGDALVQGTTTTANGGFAFSELASGTFWIMVTDTGNVLQNLVLLNGTNPQRLVVTAGQAATAASFGFGFGDDSDEDGIPDVIEGENDTDLDGTPDVFDVDTDDDGLLDAEECPSGPPCPDTDGDGIADVFQYSINDFSLRSPVYAAWNGMLQQINVATLINTAENSVDATVRLLDIDGEELSATTLGIPAKGQVDVLLNDLSGFASESYGTVVISFPSGALDGHIAYYRPRSEHGRKRADDPFDFAFAIPFENRRQGTMQAIFDTIQPSIDPLSAGDEVAHWIQILNGDGLPREFTVKLYDAWGAELSSRQVTVPANGRRDLSAGHESPGPGAVGLVEVIPTVARTMYNATLHYYGADAPPLTEAGSYSFASGVQARPGSTRKQYTTVTAGRGAVTWLAVANTSNTDGAARITITDPAGAVRSSETVYLPARGQTHIRSDLLLEQDDSALVQIEPLSGARVVARSASYYSDEDGHTLAMTSVPSRESTASAKHGSFNSFFEQLHWVKAFNTSDHEQRLTLRVYSRLGEELGSAELVVDGGKGRVFELSWLETFSTLPRDTYGFVEITGTNTVPLLAEILRVRGAGPSGYVFGAELQPLR